MSVQYVIRAFGGTLILGSGPSTPLPMLIVAANFRDGDSVTQFRDGGERALFRSGQTETHFRDGEMSALFRDGDERGESR